MYTLRASTSNPMQASSIFSASSDSHGVIEGTYQNQQELKEDRRDEMVRSM
jgi:hypothetical protein